MRLLISLALLLLIGNAEARFPRGTPLTNQITCDLTTGVASVGGPCTSGATCNGIADTAPAFWQFRTWALANQGSSSRVVLNISAGGVCLFDTNAGTVGGPLAGVSNTFVAGIHNLLVDGGAGATLKTGASGYWLGNFGVCQAGLSSGSGCSARLQTANSGATTVTLTSASLSAGYVSRFAIGDWVMFGGIDTQGEWQYSCGFPMNQHYFEWRQITNINVGTGAITIDRPLTNTYLDTWPSYNSGNPPGPGTCGGEQADNGGPATIWKVGFAGAEWSNVAEFRGLTFDNGSGQIYAQMRNVTYRNVTFTGPQGAIPTQNETWACYNCTWTDGAAEVEVDKLIGTIIFDNSTLYRMDFQSSSINSLIMNNSTISGALYGTPKSSTITDSTFGILRIGAYAYGVSTGSIVCTRCNVTTYEQGGIAQDSRNPSSWTMSGGVITFANSTVAGAGPISRIMVPGANVRFQTNNYPFGWNIGPTFQVLSITQDATNTYVQTSLAGSQPTISNFPAATYVMFLSQSVPSFTCIDCTGDPTMLVQDSTRGAPANLPPQSWGKYDFAPTSHGDNFGWNMWGALTSISINVTQAFTGSGDGELRLSEFNNIFLVDRTDYSSVTYGPTINTKVAGERIVTPSGVTCNGSPGACSGDTNLTWPTNGWLQDGIGVWMEGNLSGGGVKPLITITVITDQGVVP